MAQGVNPFEPYEANTSYSHMGRDFGNPMANMMMSMMFGHNLMPSRDDGQSMYDALIQRQRSQHFMELQRSGAANNMLFKAMGVNNNPMARSMSAMAMSSPDSAMGKLMSPLLGGNPMAASMQIYGGFAGANIMGNFGRQGNISVGETEDTMNALMGNIYKTQNYEGAGGIREELNQKTQKKLLGLAKDKNNDSYLKSMGINLTRTKSGELTEASRKQLENFEVAGSSEGDKQVKQAREEKVASLNSDLSSLLTSSDKDMAAALDDRVEKQLKAHGIATADQIKAAKHSGDKATYASKIREYLDKYQVSGGDAGTSEAKQARKDIVANLQPEIKALASTQSQEASDRLESKLRDSGALTAAQIKDIKTGGKIDSSKAAEALKKYEEAPQEASSSEDPKLAQIKYNISTKRTTANKLSNDLAAIQKLDDKDETKNAKLEAFKKSLESDLGLKSEDTDKIFEEKRGILEKNGVSSKGADRARRAIKDFAKLNPIEEAYEEGVQAKEAGKKYKGFNFENSRGFKVEDFTSAYTQAANLRALGDSRNVSVAGKMGDFSKNAGGALSAARSLFGNKSGGELVSKINDMMGEELDLSSKPGSDKAEKLLRDAKATADVAGVSINTMLGIIDATKQLAANNPRLATVSAQTTTQMALSAVSKAADIGSSMSAKDYRQAGGSQGIASDEAASQAAYMESGIGQQLAAVLGVAKGLGTMTDENGKEYNVADKIMEEMRAGKLDAADWTVGGKAHKRVAELSKGQIDEDTSARLGTSKEAAAVGMSYTDVSEAIRADKDRAVGKNFWKDIEIATAGKVTEAGFDKRVAEEKAKGAKGASIQDIRNSYIGKGVAGNSVAEQLNKTYGGTAMRLKIDQARTPEERARFEKSKAERAATEARIDKTFAANQSPIAQQMLDALMQGKDFEGTADLVGGIFATSGDGYKYKNAGSKEAVDKAKEATKNMTKISAKAEGSQSQMIELGIGQTIRDFVGGRKAEALERGEKADHLDANIKNEDLVQEAENLKNADKTSNATQARGALKDLRKMKDKGLLKPGDKLSASLKALETAEALGHLDSDEALKLAKGGDLQHIAAATVKAQQVANVDREMNKVKTSSLEDLGKTLDAGANTNEGKAIREARDFYSKQLRVSATDPAVTEKMFKDFQNPTSGAKGTNFFQDAQGNRRTDLDNSGLSRALTATQENISAAEAKLKETGKGGDTANQPLIQAMKDLLDGINNGGGIGSALSGLATALQGVR